MTSEKITMFVGSLDHTPSEQLGDLSRWHTSALIVSEGGEHWVQMPEQLAARMGVSLLRKWSGRNRNTYRKSFAREIFDCVSDYPIHVRVVSVRGSTIKEFFPVILSDLGISTHVRPIKSGAKPYLEFGPFTRVTPKGNEPWICMLPEHQAIPLLFICYFLFRAHRNILEIVKSERPTIEWIDWQLMYNKFPGDIHGPMNALFSAIMTGAVHDGLVAGSMRLGTFNEASQDKGNLLADNIAGYFAGKIRSGDRELERPSKKAMGSSLLWEVWEKDEPSSAG